jgi:hypothetical protein
MVMIMDYTSLLTATGTSFGLGAGSKKDTEDSNYQSCLHLLDLIFAFAFQKQKVQSIHLHYYDLDVFSLQL